MHSDVHLTLHADRAAQLRREATAFRLPRAGLRTRIGWTMVEVGLRLAQSSTATGAHTFRTA